jgi:hypothetical protein
MSDRNPDEIFDRRLTAALEAAPTIAVPDDFVLRVMQQLPALRAPSRMALVASPGIGRRVAFAAIFVLLAAMLAVGLRASGSIALTAVEWSFAAEFILLTVWMSLRPQVLR